MKKAILIVVALSIVLSLNFALAKDEPSGTPFDAIWSAIAKLQEQIDNIQLTPGPQGEKGDKGDKGDPGEPSWDEARIASLEARVEVLENPLIAECSASTICGNTCTHEGLTYGTVLDADGKCWLDRNLGATQVATAYNDSAAYGWIFQWGRGVDGHQITTSITTSTISISDNPGHNNFIVKPSYYPMPGPFDWRDPQNDNLWQGVSGINNPCPIGFRLPTQQDWIALISSAGVTNIDTAFNSSLKLTAAGYRGPTSGNYGGQGNVGYYWSSTPVGEEASQLKIDLTSVNPTNQYLRNTGFSVRCLR